MIWNREYESQEHRQRRVAMIKSAQLTGKVVTHEDIDRLFASEQEQAEIDETLQIEQAEQQEDAQWIDEAKEKIRKDIIRWRKERAENKKDYVIMNDCLEWKTTKDGINRLEIGHYEDVEIGDDYLYFGSILTYFLVTNITEDATIGFEGNEEFEPRTFTLKPKESTLVTKHSVWIVGTYDDVKERTEVLLAKINEAIDENKALDDKTAYFIESVISSFGENSLVIMNPNSGFFLGFRVRAKIK